MQGVHITLRMRLMCEVWRAGAAEPEQTYEVMNEVVVDRGANPYLTKIECWEHGRLITKVRKHLCGQLILATREELKCLKARKLLEVSRSYWRLHMLALPSALGTLSCRWTNQ